MPGPDGWIPTVESNADCGLPAGVITYAKTMRRSGTMSLVRGAVGDRDAVHCDRASCLVAADPEVHRVLSDLKTGGLDEHRRRGMSGACATCV